MIFNLILALLAEIVLFFFGLLPSFSAPEWLTYSMDGLAFDLGALTYKLGAWFPVDTAATIFIFVGTIIPIVVSAFVATWLWSVMPIVGKGH
jgi:hypothetical protein